jgi:hypothetical protein
MLAILSPLPGHARKKKVDEEQAKMDAALASMEQGKPLKELANWKPGYSVDGLPPKDPNKKYAAKGDEETEKAGLRTYEQALEDGYDCRNTWNGCPENRR